MDEEPKVREEDGCLVWAGIAHGLAAVLLYSLVRIPIALPAFFRVEFDFLVNAFLVILLFLGITWALLPASVVMVAAMLITLRPRPPRRAYLVAIATFLGLMVCGGDFLVQCGLLGGHA